MVAVPRAGPATFCSSAAFEHADLLAWISGP